MNPTSSELSSAPAVALRSRLLLLAALLVPWGLIWQGLDITDQGYLLTIYRQFLRHPESVAQAAHMWLTNVLGGLWDAAFGGLGVIAHRAQWATCLSLGLWFAYSSVRRVTGPQAAALGVLATSVFICDRRETWFSYNSLTALINAAVVYTLARGLSERNWRWLVLGGALLGASPFGRLPNVLGLALATAPAFAALIEPARRAHFWREQGSVLAGCAAGVALMLLAIWLGGYWSIYREGLGTLFAPSVAKTGHGTGALLDLFMRDQTSALLSGAAVCGGLLLCLFGMQRLPLAARVAGVVLLAVAGAYGLTTYEGARDPEAWRTFVVGACYVTLGALTLVPAAGKTELRVTAYLALGALIVTPMGSDGGTLNAHWGIWTALPLLIATLYQGGLQPRLEHSRLLALVAAGVVTLEGLVRIQSFTYRDAPREQLTASIAHPQLRGIHTSPGRARVLSEVLQALDARVSPGDYLLTSESTPLLQYLTRSRPYLGIPWIMVDEDLAQIAERLERGPREKGCLPVVVRAKGNPRTRLWPRDVKRGVDGKHKPARRLLTAFLERHAYRRTWQNSYFEILQPDPNPALRTSACR